MEVSYLYGTACMKNKSLTSHLIFFKFEYHTLKRCKGKAFFITQQAILYIFMQSGEGNGNPLQYSCLENPMDGGAWQAAVHGVTKSDTTEQLHFHFSVSSIGEGNGSPLQCSCLENPRNGGPWWVAVYGVAQSQARLKQLSSSIYVERDLIKSNNIQLSEHYYKLYICDFLYVIVVRLQAC